MHQHHIHTSKPDQSVVSNKHGHRHHEPMIRDFKRRFWICLILTVPIVLLSPMIQELAHYTFRFRGDRMLQFSISSLVFFYGGWPFLKGLVDELKKGKPGMMTLISLAITVAYFYSSAVVFGLGGMIFFWELCSLIDIMLLGHWFEMRSVMGASNSLQELAQLLPDTARRITSETAFEDIPLSELQKGDLILVRPGERIPADGIIVEGESRLNESMISGESVPIKKSVDDPVTGGSVNDSGTLRIRIEKTGSDAYLSRVIKMVEQAQQTKSRAQDLANKAAGWLFYIALGSGIVTLIVWLALGEDIAYALERMVTVMIISCPHALGLAVPLVVAISTGMSARNGLLIRNRSAFENARKISTIIFDKTGTLTKGDFGVSEIKTLSKELTEDEMLRLAATLETGSEHPIAAGILRKAKEKNMQLLEATETRNLKGEGVEGKVNGRKLRILSPGAAQKSGISMPDSFHNDGQMTVVYVLQDQDLLGWIALSDELREDSFRAVERLKQKGIKVIMATGDNKQVAAAIAQKLKLDDYYAEVLPEDKQRIIRELQEKGEFVAMAGDGVNDAPALAAADVGIAIGSGTDVAAETADIILVDSNPNDVVRLIHFGGASYRKILQNLWWAAGYNIIAIPLAAGALASYGFILSPAIGAVLMSLSTIVVALNAQLLRKQMKIKA